jgi:AcrR family transcriptional regulator
MAAAVKSSQAPRRGDRAATTRRRIVAAARELFLADGYAATTLQAVAERSGVAVQTVYFHFGNKRTVLKHVVDVAATGDDEPVALLDRPWVTRMREAPDAPAAIAVWCEVSVEIYDRIAPIMRVVREASGSDPDMAEQEQTNRSQTLTAHRMLAEHLAERDALREGLSIEQAASELFVLMSLEVYVLTTASLGWSPTRWRDWAAGTATRSVLR